MLTEITKETHILSVPIRNTAPREERTVDKTNKKRKEGKDSRNTRRKS